MNRRGFLKLLGLAAPAAVVVPKYFFAPIGGWKSDIIAHSTTCKIGRYDDYYSESDMRLSPAIDPAIKGISKELAYRSGLCIETLIAQTLFLKTDALQSLPPHVGAHSRLYSPRIEA